MILVSLLLEISLQLLRFISHIFIGCFLISLQKVNLSSKLFHLRDGDLLQHRLLPSHCLDSVHLLRLRAIHLIHELVRLLVLDLGGGQLAILVGQGLNDFINVEVLHELHLASHALQMVQPLNLLVLELDQLVLFDLLELHLVPESVEYLVLRSDFVLNLLELLLEDLFTLLSLGELLPEDRVRAILLLEIVDLVVMLLFLNSFFETLKHACLFDELLQGQDLIPCLCFTLLQPLHLLKDYLIVVVMGIGAATSLCVWIHDFTCIRALLEHV